MHNRARILRNFGIMFLLLTLYLAVMLPGYSDAGVRQAASYLTIGFAVATVICFAAAVITRRRQPRD